MNRCPTATLWVFAYSGLTAATHMAIMKECKEWTNLEIWVMGEEALIYRGRSRAATQFLNSERDVAGDVLLMVDHDIQWQAGDLAHIARRALERGTIVGGIYPKRVFGEGSAVRFKEGIHGEWQIGNDALIEVEYVGSGFIAIPRLVLDSLARRLPLVKQGYYPFFQPMFVERSEGWDDLSEDYAFCERAREQGYLSYASCYPRLTHEGRHTFRLIDSRMLPPKDELLNIKL